MGLQRHHVIQRYQPAHDTAVWVLHRRDLLGLLLNVPEFARRMREHLMQPDVAVYLESQHGLNTDKVMRWIQTAVKDIDIGKLTPAAAEAMKACLAALWRRCFSNRSREPLINSQFPVFPVLRLM